MMQQHEFLKMHWVFANCIIPCTHACTCTDRQTHRQADTITQTWTHRDTDIQTHNTHMHTNTHTHTYVKLCQPLLK